MAILHAVLRAPARVGRGLRSPRVVEAASDRALLLPLALVRLDLRALLRLPRAPRRLVRAGVNPPRAPMNSQRARRQLFEQRPIVRDDDAHPAKAPQRPHEQRAPRRVEMIGGLVEEQHLRVRRERRADLPALALPGRERRPALELPGIELELPRKPACGSVAPLRKPFNFRREVLHRLRTDHDQRRRRLAANVPFVRLKLAREQAEQGGLSSAVLTDQASPAGGQVQIDRVEERNSVGIGEREAMNAQRRHHEKLLNQAGERPGIRCLGQVIDSRAVTHRRGPPSKDWSAPDNTLARAVKRAHVSQR